MNIREMFEMHLNDNNLPGEIVAILKEKIYAVLYLGEVFIVQDPLDGFYGLCEDFPTLRDYMIEEDIGIKKSIEEFMSSMTEIYNKQALLNVIRLIYADSLENTV